MTPAEAGELVGLQAPPITSETASKVAAILGTAA